MSASFHPVNSAGDASRGEPRKRRTADVVAAANRGKRFIIPFAAAMERRDGSGRIGATLPDCANSESIMIVARGAETAPGSSGAGDHPSDRFAAYAYIFWPGGPP